VKIYDLKQDFNAAFARKKYGFIGFNDKRILICHGGTDDAYLNGALKPGYLYITANDYSAINTINKKHVQQMLVIDGNNNDHFIKTLRMRADSDQVKYCVLKRNKSLLIVSN